MGKKRRIARNKKKNFIALMIIMIGASGVLLGAFASLAIAQEAEKKDEKAAAATPVAKAPEKKKNNSAKRISEKRATKQDVLLIQGIQSTLDIPFEPCASPPEECIRVANKGLLQTQYAKEKKQLIFTPIKRGETTITLRDEKGDIRLILGVVVSENNLSRRANELKELLRDIEGIEIKIMGEKILIDGEVVVVGDLNRLYAVLADDSYKGLVMNLVGVSPVGMQMLAERIQGEINKPNVKVRPFSGAFLLEGQVDSEGERDAIAAFARKMISGIPIPKFNSDAPSGAIDLRRQKVEDPIINRLSVAGKKPPPPEKMVRMTIDFVELSKDYLRNFGFTWSPSLDTGGSVSFGQSTTGGVTSEGSGSLAGTIGNLFPKLSTAQNAGYARVLEESVVLVKNGKEVTMERTLAIPIQTVNAQGQPTFNQQNIGPVFNITPTIVGQTEDVELAMKFAYAGIAGKNGNAFITLNHKFNSNVIVKSTESAAVVNALSNVVSTAFNKDPVGAQPVNPLFTLLRSKAFQKSKSQFVIFVTPQIIESASVGTDDIKSKYGLRRKQN